MQVEDKNLKSPRPLSRDLSEVFGYIKQREDSVLKILEAFSKIESTSETGVINNCDFNNTLTQAENFRIEQEDKVASKNAKHKANNLENQSCLRNFIQKVLELYLSILGKYYEKSSSLLERDFHLSCCLAIETMKNLLSKPIIEFELALVSAIRPSRVQLSKGIESIKRFNMRSYVSALPLITRQDNLKDNHIDQRKNSLVSISLEKDQPPGHLSKVISPKKVSLTKMQVKRQNENFHRSPKELSQNKDTNLSIERKTFKPVPDRMASPSDLTEKQQSDSQEMESNRLIADRSNLQPYPVMRIDDFSFSSNYKGMAVVDKYLGVIDGILKKKKKIINESESHKQQTKENNRQAYLSLGVIHDMERKGGTLITEVVTHSLEDLKPIEQSPTLPSIRNNLLKVMDYADTSHEKHPSRSKKLEIDVVSLKGPLYPAPKPLSKTPRYPLMSDGNPHKRFLSPISTRDDKPNDFLNKSPKLSIKNLRLPSYIQSKIDSNKQPSSNQADEQIMKVGTAAQARNEPVGTQPVSTLVSPKALALNRNHRSNRKIALAVKRINLDEVFDYQKVVEL